MVKFKLAIAVGGSFDAPGEFGIVWKEVPADANACFRNCRSVASGCTSGGAEGQQAKAKQAGLEIGPGGIRSVGCLRVISLGCGPSCFGHRHPYDTGLSTP